MGKKFQDDQWKEMKFKRLKISHDELLRLIHYDPLTGEFISKVYLGQRAPAGKILGSDCNEDGYWMVGLHGSSYMAHRLAWFYMNGEWPVNRIDHRDLDKRNNRYDNLRLSSQSQNKANVGLELRNKSGRKGVYFDKNLKKYRATIKVHGKRINLGSFTDLDEGAAAYDKAALQYFGEFALTNAMIKERLNDIR